MHDVDDYKLVGEKSKKFENAVGFLKSQNYPENKIEIICHNISQISFKGKDSIIPDTIEGEIAQDADRLDALGAIGIARAFTYGGNKNRAIYIPEQKYKGNMTEEEYYSNNGATINHFYEKILKIKEMLNTKTAKSIAKHRYEYVELYLKEFFDEWNGTI